MQAALYNFPTDNNLVNSALPQQLSFCLAEQSTLQPLTLPVPACAMLEHSASDGQTPRVTDGTCGGAQLPWLSNALSYYGACSAALGESISLFPFSIWDPQTQARQQSPALSACRLLHPQPGPGVSTRSPAPCLSLCLRPEGAGRML